MQLINNYWRRIAIVLTGLGVTLAGLTGLAALAGAASAATTMLPAGQTVGGGAAPAVPAVVAGGTPGWQIALIAVGAALVAAVLAVLLDRARHSRIRLTSETA